VALAERGGVLPPQNDGIAVPRAEPLSVALEVRVDGANVYGTEVREKGSDLGMDFVPGGIGVLGGESFVAGEPFHGPHRVRVVLGPGDDAFVDGRGSSARFGALGE